MFQPRDRSSSSRMNPVSSYDQVGGEDTAVFGMDRDLIRINVGDLDAQIDDDTFSALAAPGEDVLVISSMYKPVWRSPNALSIGLYVSWYHPNSLVIIIASYVHELRNSCDLLHVLLSKPH